MSSFTKHSKAFYKDIKKNIIKAGTFNRKEINCNIPSNITGIYMIYLAGTNKCVYVGETISSIRNRIYSHKRSINNPTSPQERSGKKIHKAKLQNKNFDIRYITAKDLKIKNKLDSLTVEGMIAAALKPIIYGENK